MSSFEFNDLDRPHVYLGSWWFGGFLGVLRQSMWFIFNIDPFYALFTVLDDNQDLSSSLPSDDFPGEGDVLSFRDVIHHKCMINIPKRYAILLRIECKTR